MEARNKDGQRMHADTNGAGLAPERQRRRVLFVDDSTDMQAIMKDFLEAEGYEVTAVGSAHVALRLLRAESFQLVVTDQMLPDETGGWLLKQAEALGLLREAGAVVVTANSFPEEIDRPRGVPVFQKPVPLEPFLGTVGRLLEGAAGEVGADGADGAGGARPRVGPVSPR